LSEEIAEERLAKEKVYFAQVRYNSQVTIPKEAMSDKKLQKGDIIAIAIIKLIGKDTPWKVLKDTLPQIGGEN